MFGDYYQVRDWLEGFIPQTYTAKNLGLGRISYLLKLLDNPQDKFKSIHVAGTSGKGSTAFYIARLMEFAAVGSSAAIKKRSANIETSSIGLISPRSGFRPHQILKNNLDDDLSGLRHVFDWQQQSRSMSNVSGPADAKTLAGKQLSNVKVGLHLSPHLVDIRERMQVFGNRKQETGNKKQVGSLMSMGRFLELFNEIQPVVEKIKKDKPDLTPSYFEILVAASFKYFAEEKVDWAVVEVGLGGRLDATNVLLPKLTVITNVGLDHTDVLGKTVEEIAHEKAGIIKGNVPVVTGALRLRSGLRLRGRSDSRRSSTIGQALKVIEKVAKEKNAPLIKVNTQLGIEPLKSDTKDYLIKYYDIVRHMPQNFVLENVLLAIIALKTLGFKVSKPSLKKVLSSPFPGRFEQIDDPTSSAKGGLRGAGDVILDGAHNLDKIHSLFNFIGKLKVKSQKSKVDGVVLVVAFKKGKQWQKMIDLLVKNLPVKKVISTKFHAVTDMGRYQTVDPKEIKDYLDTKYKIQDTRYFNNSHEAVFEALDAKHLDPNQLILVTGSLYLVGEVRTIWYLPSFDN